MGNQEMKEIVNGDLLKELDKEEEMLNKKRSKNYSVLNSDSSDIVNDIMKESQTYKNVNKLTDQSAKTKKKNVKSLHKRFQSYNNKLKELEKSFLKKDDPAENEVDEIGLEIYTPKIIEPYDRDLEKKDKKVFIPETEISVLKKHENKSQISQEKLKKIISTLKPSQTLTIKCSGMDNLTLRVIHRASSQEISIFNIAYYIEYKYLSTLLDSESKVEYFLSQAIFQLDPEKKDLRYNLSYNLLSERMKVKSLFAVSLTEKEEIFLLVHFSCFYISSNMKTEFYIIKPEEELRQAVRNIVNHFTGKFDLNEALFNTHFNEYSDEDNFSLSEKDNNVEVIKLKEKITVLQLKNNEFANENTSLKQELIKKTNTEKKAITMNNHILSRIKILTEENQILNERIKKQNEVIKNFNTIDLIENYEIDNQSDLQTIDNYKIEEAEDVIDSGKKQSAKQLDEIEERLKCIICMKNDKEVLYINCGHLSKCLNCFNNCLKRPINRKSIQDSKIKSITNGVTCPICNKNNNKITIIIPL